MEKLNYQSAVLNECRRNKVGVVLFTVNGYQVRGTITGYDDEVVVLVDDHGKQMMIYKNAISTVIPGMYVSMG